MLSGVFAGVVPFALLLVWPSMLPFTVGALGCAALLGLGNGAVFKLVPQFFPRSIAHGHRPGRRDRRARRLLPAAAARLLPRPPRRGLAGVRAAGADGGRRSGCSTRRLFLPRQRALERGGAALLTSRQAEQLRAGAWATHGDRRCWWPRSWSARATCRTSIRRWWSTPSRWSFATWGIVYHYAVWLQKPPTRRFFERTFELMRAAGPLAQRCGARRRHAGDPPARADVHPQALAPALVDAPAPLLGLPARGRDHVPAGVRLDPLRVGARTTR